MFRTNELTRALYVLSSLPVIVGRYSSYEAKSRISRFSQHWLFFSLRTNLSSPSFSIGTGQGRTCARPVRTNVFPWKHAHLARCALVLFAGVTVHLCTKLFSCRIRTSAIQSLAHNILLFLSLSNSSLFLSLTKQFCNNVSTPLPSLTVCIIVRLLHWRGTCVSYEGEHSQGTRARRILTPVGHSFCTMHSPWQWKSYDTPERRAKSNRNIRSS